MLNFCLLFFAIDHQAKKKNWNQFLFLIFFQQLVHDKELAAEDEQVFLTRQQVKKPKALLYKTSL